MERAARKPSVVTPERFASGMTFAQYVAFVGSAANLAREGSGLTFRSGAVARRDFSSHFRDWYAANPLSEAQVAADATGRIATVRRARPIRRALPAS